MRIAVCDVDHLGSEGGADLMNRNLIAALEQAGHEVESIRIPATDPSPGGLLSDALAWRTIDITEVNGRRIDMAIALRYPAYLVRHPHKVIWLTHQVRGLYDLWATQFGFPDTPEWTDTKRRVADLDLLALTEATAAFALSQVVADRLERSHGIRIPHLHHPAPRLTPTRPPSDGGYVLAPGRLVPIKRQDLLTNAIATSRTRPPAVITGTGPWAAGLANQVEELGIADRVRFAGHVDSIVLSDLFAGCRAVFVGGVDEDFGYVALEAMQLGKPVIITTDGGEPLRFITNEESGVVVEPTVTGIAAALDRIWDDPGAATAMGTAGRARLTDLDLSWDRVVDTLTGVTA